MKPKCAECGMPGRTVHRYPKGLQPLRSHPFVEAEAAQLDVDRLAAALPGVMSAKEAAEVYGEGMDPLDVPEEWYMTPREMAAAILAALPDGGLDVERLAAAMRDTAHYLTERRVMADPLVRDWAKAIAAKVKKGTG